MILEEIGVFLKVDCFEGEFAESFATVCIGCGAVSDTTATELGAGSILSAC